MLQSKTINLVSLVILNCIGSGVLLVPRKIAGLGLNAIYAWIVTCLGSVSIGIIFAKLNEDTSEISTVHDIVGSAFKENGSIRAIVFWLYYLFAVFGNAVFVLELANLIKMITSFNAFQEVLSYFLIFGTVYAMNRFGIGVSRLFTTLLVLLKFIILLILPLICAFKVWPNFNLIWCSIKISPNLIMRGAFSTLWAYLGIETLSIGQKASYKSLSKAVLFGSLICLIIYILNTVLLFSMLDNIHQSASCYRDLFSILFGKYSNFITVLVSAIILFGMLHGWTLAASGTLAGGQRIIPKYLFKLNKYKVPEVALAISTGMAFAICTLLRLFPSNASFSNYLVDTSTSMCLIVYLLGVVGFGKELVTIYRRNSLSKNPVNLYILFSAFVYCALAISTSPRIANLSSLFVVFILGIFYVRI
jgi:putrescine:ornithine antiporter